MALRAGLREMVRNGNQIAILAPISGGIYSGKGTSTNLRINSEYEQIINELLNERDCELLLNEISVNQFTHMVLFASQDIECEFLEIEYKDDYYIITKIIN